MEQIRATNILDDRRIKLLNYLLQKNKIPDKGAFDLRKLIADIQPDEFKELFAENPEFETIWRDVDMSKSLANFLVENDLAKQQGERLQLTGMRGQDLQKQGSYGKLLEDERHITNEARRVSELELEADRTAHRQYKINALIAFGTCMAALYYLLEILNGFFGFYHYSH
jgi:hypothetical protein